MQKIVPNSSIDELPTEIPMTHKTKTQAIGFLHVVDRLNLVFLFNVMFNLYLHGSLLYAVY